MMGVGLYSCSAVDRPSPLPNTISIWPGFRRRFLGLGTGVMRSERRLTSNWWAGPLRPAPNAGPGIREDGSFEETFLRHAEVP